MTVISAAFAPLARVIARRLGIPGLPIVVIEHPVGDSHLEKVRQKGRGAVEAVVHALASPAESLEAEFLGKRFPPAPGVAPKL